jgi:hypothetical protein
MNIPEGHCVCADCGNDDQDRLVFGVCLDCGGEVICEDDEAHEEGKNV